MENKFTLTNRKVKFEYHFIETHIVGIKLVGTEMKPIKDGKVSIVDSFCYFNGDELYVKNIIIDHNGTHYSHEPNRERKLLMKKRELVKLKKQLINGITLVPYRFFINDRGLVKMEIVLAKGKKTVDKRETIKKRESEREIKNFI